MSDLISRLSEIRGQYNCFIDSEEPYYRALSEVIKMLSEQADGDTISRQAAIDIANDLRACISVDGYWAWVERLERLPSAQPDTSGNTSGTQTTLDCISRQAAIDAFYEMASDIDHLCTVGDYVRVLETLPTIEPEPHWIPCSHELPDIREFTSKTVLCCDEYGGIYTATYNKLGEWHDDAEYADLTDVIAWMPIPEAFREGD